MNLLAPIQPATTPPPPASPSVGAGGSPSARRTFADDGSLWESVRLRCQALLEDLRQPDQREPLTLVAILAMLLMFSYWPGLLNAKAAWNNPQYSHGWLVPLFSVAMLFWWRQPVEPVSPSARFVGLGMLLASLGLRLLMARYRIITIDMYTFVPALAGVFLLGGGWSMFRWAWAPIAFLIFMYPLPDEATRYLLGPLQTVATMVSTYAIQTLGIDAIREGNQIVVGERHLGVVDACSGLRMLTIFIALSVAIVMLGELDVYEGLVILASAVPIALAVNATRITLTGVMYTIDPEIAEKIFHDWAGYFMMPMALALLFCMRKLASSLIVTEETAPAAVIPLEGLKAFGLAERAGSRRNGGVSRGPATLSGQIPRPAGDRAGTENRLDDPR
ncbi:MAG: exosortase/archaeosortase family protein [Planctomycetia bacterium]